MSWSTLGILLAFICSVAAYVPALGSNLTGDAIAGGLNLSDASQLKLQWELWDRNWDYSVEVLYQLVGYGSKGLSRGPLIHFSEVNVTEDTPPTSTPFIALVSCDFNATNASDYTDVFTLARDKGAVAALLYSLNHTACIINAEYADPMVYDQVFDIFSTPTDHAAQMIEFQFQQLRDNGTAISWYDSQKLNDSGADINATIRGERKTIPPGFVFATLRAANSSASLDSDMFNSTSPETPSSNRDGGGGTRTTLAMIVLYVITGCVSVLFCVVIISGAVRAIRHPERYGPRSGDQVGDGEAQSRARGLTRAILDTFPIVKFGNNSQSDNTILSPAKDVEDGPSTPMDDLSKPPFTIPPKRVLASSDTPPVAVQEASGSSGEPSSLAALLQPRVRAANSNPDGLDVLPDAIGKETCPICIVDFEEGDDLRQLPCEGQHRFHQDCVDPWLLELSSSCPICRHDFLALEEMLSATDAGHDEPSAPPSPSQPVRPPSPTGNRFSRYVRFAIKRRRRRDDDDDPTYPDLPTSSA